MRSTVHVNLPMEMKQEMDLLAKDLGFTSVANYFAFLHSAVGSALKLGEPERLILRELAVWQNFRSKGTPVAKEVAAQVRLMEDYIPAAVAKLEGRDLVRIDKEPRGEYYSMDMMLPDGRHVWVTPKGLAAALVPPDIIPRLQVRGSFARRTGTAR
jgi:hypothetical protein